MNSDGFFSADDVQNSLQKANIAWKPSSQFMEYTKALFKALLQDNMENKVPGKAVVSLFRKTSLPNATLKQIWTTASLRNDGSLNFVEFTVALQLIAIAYAGGEISLKSLSMDSKNLTASINTWFRCSNTSRNNNASTTSIRIFSNRTI